MTVRGSRRTRRSVGAPLGLAAVLLVAALAAACDVAFDPYQENTIGPFSIFGYLDLRADTQWIRVAPIRQGLLAEPAPLDAVVTLEHLGTGRVVTLRDSLFAFNDPRLDAVGYAHNFWTTEPLEPEAAYRLRAVRSDGAATTALVEMPPEFAVILLFEELVRVMPGTWVPRQFRTDPDNLLYAETIYTVWDPTVDRGGDPVGVREQPEIAIAGLWGFALPGITSRDALNMPPLIDVFRRQTRVVVARSDWPYVPDLTGLEVIIPGVLPTTVENGIGFVGGVASWTIPLVRCVVLEPRPDTALPCTTVFDPGSASIEGRVTGAPCSGSRQLPTVRLTERFANGGAVVWVWTTDWDGTYRFEGLQPGSELVLEVAGHPGALHLPAPGPGEHYVVRDIAVSIDCVHAG